MQITSPQNPLIKQLRALQQRKERQRSGLFLVEGLLPIGAALESGWEIVHLLYDPERLESAFAQRLLQEVKARGGDVRPVSPRVLEGLSEKENPQGMVAVVRQRTRTLQEVALAAGVAVALVSPQDSGNVGTVLRTLDAVGGKALFLLEGGVDPYHPGVVRASMGALFWVPWVQSSFGEFISWAQAQGIFLLGTSAHAAQDYRQLQPPQPFVLILGNEQKGLSAAQRAACDAEVALPMRGRASSLNLAVAAGVLLYHYVFEA
jgi:TrmH family RNA methyltransferase